MKKTFLFLISLMAAASMHAIDDNTVEVVFNGTTATITIADNIADSVTVSSGESSHVVITSKAGKITGEVTYALSGTSEDGNFTLKGEYKCEIDLNGLTLTNPNGPALNIQNGKRTAISAKKNTVNTLTNGKDKDYKGCIHCTGHLEFKGKGELNIASNYKHGIYSEEYVSIKNLTLNITQAEKDGIHCQEYFLMESGNVTISNVGDDGIQCELAGEVSTGEIEDDHEDEDTGNVYQLDGTLTIDNYGGEPVKADGEIFYRGGTQNFTTTGIAAVTASATLSATVCDLQGRRVINPTRGIYLLNGRKVVIK